MSQLFRFPSAVKRDLAIEAWMHRHADELGAIAQRWFEVMRACGDDVRELLHDGHPTACVDDAAFGYVNAFKAHVNVGFFRGAELPDPSGLLEGTGKFMRHVKLSPQSDVDATALMKLIETAYTDMKGRLKAEATNPPKRQAPKLQRSAIQWLLDSDPSIRWQVMRDLIGAPADKVAAERARVATEGAGARLLSLQGVCRDNEAFPRSNEFIRSDEVSPARKRINSLLRRVIPTDSQGADGRWGGAAWNRGWNSTIHVLMLLRDMGLDPASAEARRAVRLVRDHVTWQGCGPQECDGNPFFSGEVEPCINGQVAAVGAYFGQDVRGIVDRLLAEQLPDGGWNCEAANGSTRSSFNTTICVLEALLEHERAGGATPKVTAARLRGEEYLLERRLFRRRSTGEMIERDRKGGVAWTRFAFPTWWHYDVLRGLEYLRRADVAPDQRVAEAIELVNSKRDGEGRWPLEVRHPGEMPVEMDEGEGRPSRWNTLRALRVLNWYSA